MSELLVLKSPKSRACDKQRLSKITDFWWPSETKGFWGFKARWPIDFV